MAQQHAAVRTGDDDLVTGEAVALDLPPASVAVRAVSGLIDLTLAAVLLVVSVVAAYTLAGETDGALLAAAMLVSTVLVLLGLPAGSETFTRGRTLGKWVMGLRAVRDDAGPVSARHALTRALVGFVEVWLLSGVPALLCALVNRRSKRVGDLVAGTYVVRDRFRLVLPPPVLMPPGLAGWAARADLAALPTGLALAVRQFLARAATLDPSSRAATGVRLAEQVSRYAAPAPPPGTHPEAFLAAVLCERRTRDLARLHREQELRNRLDRAVRSTR